MEQTAMKNAKYVLLALIAAAGLLTSGCRNEVDKAIMMLDGDKAQQEEAMGIIAMSAQDPMPRLVKALHDTKKSVRIREKVAMLIGIQGEKSGSDVAVSDLVAALSKSEESVQLAILGALDKTPGKKAIEALRNALSGKSPPPVKKKASELLNAKAAKLVESAEALFGDAAIPKIIELLEEALAINPDNQQVRLKLIGYYSLSGQQDKANEFYDANGAFVRAVKVLGPFPLKPIDHIDPKTSNFSKPAATADGASMKWFDFNDVNESGKIDFRKDSRTRVFRSIFYAGFKINSDEQKTAALNVYVRDKAKIWLNGALLDFPDATNEQEERTLKVKLRKGDNTMLLMLGSMRQSRFSVRVSNPDGGKLDGISYGL